MAREINPFARNAEKLKTEIRFSMSAFQDDVSAFGPA
jgi:hypothetical protein